MRTAASALLILLAATPLSAAGNPSFDCDVARTDVERMICGDDELSDLDLELARAFAGALARAAAQDVTDLQASHEAWLQRRNRCGRTPDMRACAFDAYRERLDEL